MIEEYLNTIIKDSQKFKDPFSGKKLRQELIYYPICANVPITLITSNISARLAFDYNLEYYSPTGISLSVASKKIINEGTFHIINQNLTHVIIIGMYGIGKSNFLKQLLYFYAIQDQNCPNYKIPILVNVDELDFDSAASLRNSILKKIPDKKKTSEIFLLIDGMAEKIGIFLHIFKEFAGCIFTSSYKQFLPLADFKVFSLEALPIPVQISRAQQELSSVSFLDFIGKITSGKCQFAEFCRMPYFISYFLANYEQLKALNKGNLYKSFIKTIMKRTDVWKELEHLASELLEKEITVFGFHEVRALGHSTKWESLKDLAIFEHSEPPQYFSLEIESCSDIECEFNSYLMDFPSKDSVTEFNVTKDCQMLRFCHIRLIETLAAMAILNKIEDSISSIRKSTYIETCEFQKVFSNAFSNNFLFSRKYQEVLVLFSQLCPDNLFENLIKFLISMNTIEHCYIADRLLKENNQNNFQHLQNKIDFQKQDLYMKNFPQGLTHLSCTVRNICKGQLGSINVSANALITEQISSILLNSNWLMLFTCKQMIEFVNSEEVYSSVTQQISLLLEAIQAHSSSPCTYFNVLLRIFVKCIEKNRQGGSTTYSPSKTDEIMLDENTMRISLENIRICRGVNTESATIYSRLEKGLLEILKRTKGVDLKVAIKALLCSNSKKKTIRCSLVQRSVVFPDEKGKILESLLFLDCSDEETIGFVLMCYQDKDLKIKAKEILKTVDIIKLKEISSTLVLNKKNEGVLGYSFCCRYEIDNEILEELLCCIDDSDTYLSFLSVISLINILKPVNFISSQRTLNLLSPLAEIVMDRLQLIKNISEISIFYVKGAALIYNLLGELEKIVGLFENILSRGLENETSFVYKFLVKKSVNVRYLDGIKKYFTNGVYGNKAKYALKIAEINVEWANESIAIMMILDNSGKTSEKSVALLLDRWGLVHLLQVFLNISHITYIIRIGNILKCVDKKKYFVVKEKFFAVIREIEKSFLGLVEENGVIIVEIISIHGTADENVKEWMKQYIIDTDNLSELLKSAEIWAKLCTTPFQNDSLISKLLDFLKESPQNILKIALLLKPQSDKLLSEFFPHFLSKSLPLSFLDSTILTLLQLSDSSILLSIYKLTYFSHSDPDFCYNLHLKIRKIIKKIQINDDIQFEKFLEVLCKNNCSIFMEQIWKYLVSKTLTNPRYFLTDYSEKILKSTISWDSRFTFRVCKIIGLIRNKRIEEELTGAVITQKNF